MGCFQGRVAQWKAALSTLEEPHSPSEAIPSTSQGGSEHSDKSHCAAASSSGLQGCWVQSEENEATLKHLSWAPKPGTPSLHPSEPHATSSVMPTRISSRPCPVSPQHHPPHPLVGITLTPQGKPLEGRGRIRSVCWAHCPCQWLHQDTGFWRTSQAAESGWDPGLRGHKQTAGQRSHTESPWQASGCRLSGT